MTNNQGKTALGVPPQEQKSKKYRDRPADEGKHGDAAEEPNSGVPSSSSQDAPGRPKSSSSRQQTSAGQVTQTGSPELDGGHSRPPGRNQRGV
jgi:hypothetical protein